MQGGNFDPTRDNILKTLSRLDVELLTEFTLKKYTLIPKKYPEGVKFIEYLHFLGC